MRFEFATATRIIFGPKTSREIAPLASQMGQRAFVVTGSTTRRATHLLDDIGMQGIEHTTFNVSSEPTVTTVAAAVQQARRAHCDVVIAIGGGSAIDTGKAVATMLTNTGELTEYLEVVGRGQPLRQPSMPCIAVPTTAGTGAEVTRNAVLGVPEHRRKVSMRSPLLLPRLSVVDPDLALSLPPDVTGSTGLDALTQLLEAFVSNKANPLTDAICREGLRRAARSLGKAYEDGADADAREDMSLASLFSGLALANAKLGAVHGIAGALGGMIDAPHGAICGSLLPHVMEANIKALADRASDCPALTRYQELARLLTGKPNARAQDAVQWAHDLCRRLRTPSLTDLGLEEQEIPALVDRAGRSSSMKGNPIELGAAELTEIIEHAAQQPHR